MHKLFLVCRFPSFPEERLSSLLHTPSDNGNAKSSGSKPTSRPIRQSDPHRGANISIQQEQPPPSLVSRPRGPVRS
ncbi:hypothetical protein FRC03_012776 [Tulasnella sp. 419]|nr:hypothetical protein FRC03_012776 [Tulasnella sp. 419]